MAGFTVGPWLVPWNLHRASRPESKHRSHSPRGIILQSSRFVDFAMHRVRMLQHFGVIPYIVFDGDYLPSKAATEADRAKRREESKKAGLELLNAGKTSQAYLEFQKAVDVTPEMARQLIEELKKSGVQYIVAPYEADAQMVYLERKDIIDGILSEDSDLLVFGAKCLLTKLDQYGNCIEINKADFCACKEISLTGWSDTEFRQMAILSGCDYLASISNIGLKTAYRMVRKYKTIEKVIRMLQFDGKFFVPKGYLEAFHRAELTFLHQRVFCPLVQSLVLHTEPDHPIDEDKMPFIGAYVEPKIAQGVARGDLNPMTKLPIVVTSSSSKKMVTSTTPWSSRPNHQRSASFVDPKKEQPLGTFFKPKRIPLAELDINCFTPSPTQQEALRRNSGAAWAASPVPRPYLHRSATQPENIPQSAPQPVRNQTVRTARAPTISEPRPPKRVRLCADIDTVVSPSKKAELGPSPFFTSTVSEPSPTVGRNARSKRSKKQEINIFSDDSIEEAMLSLPDVEGFGNTEPRSSSRIHIFDEQTPNRSNQTRPECLQSQGADEQAESQDTTPSLTTSMSATSSAEQPPTPKEASSIPGSGGMLKSRFAFSAANTSTPKSPGNTRGLSTPISSYSRPSRIPLAVKNNAPTPKTSTKPNITPLQRLGATATNRLKFPETPPLTPTCSVKPKSPRRSLLSKSSVPFPEVDRATKSNKIEPASVPLPTPDEAENAALSMQSGSEDMMIHDSEEDEALSPSPEDGYESAPHIDLGRFAFVAKASGI
jgi:exonuclease 1